jgi:septal ring factor EnvC (AmiA/AmiB activator)
MRRLSEESPESPVIEIHERQWTIRNWLLGGLVAAVLILLGLIYAGIRVNESREIRNRALANSPQVAADLKDAVSRVSERTTDARITSLAAAAAETAIRESTDRIARLSGKLSQLEGAQQSLNASLGTLQEYGNKLAAENEKLRADLLASNSRIVALQSELLADSIALSERSASLDRRIRTVADQAADLDRRLGRSSTAMRGFGGMSVANLAVSMIHLLGTKQTADVKPTASTVGQ